MEDLVIAAKSGDSEAFAKLIRSQKETLYRTGKSYLSNDEDIADVVQETILICYEKLDTLKTPKFFKTWMVRIMINQCKKFLRKTKPAVEMGNVPEKVSETVSAESQMCFQDMMNSLEDIYRPAMTLFYGEGFSIRDIAQILDVSEDVVKKRLSRARAILRKQYFAYIK